MLNDLIQKGFLVADKSFFACSISVAGVVSLFIDEVVLVVSFKEIDSCDVSIAISFLISELIGLICCVVGIIISSIWSTAISVIFSVPSRIFSPLLVIIVVPSVLLFSSPSVINSNFTSHLFITISSHFSSLNSFITSKLLKNSLFSSGSEFDTETAQTLSSWVLSVVQPS